MRKVLIVSPHFPPINAPDMQRVRMSLPHYADFGWNPIVLAVRTDSAEGVYDPLLLKTVPGDIPIRHSSAFSIKWTRKLGVGAIGLRAWPFLRNAGSELIRKYRPDLIYFSTTAFPVMTLGRVWKKKFGVPFVVDMQDPWVSDYYDKRKVGDRPPKHRLAQRMHRTLEPWTMKAVDGIIAVSDNYHETLRERYPWITKDVCRTIPFGASENDFEIASKMEWRNPFFAPGDGLIHGVYVGVLGRVMTHTCRAICLGLKRGLESEPALFSKLRLYFIGTDYAPAGRSRQTIRPIAEELGLQNHVHEDTNRVPYFSALRLMQDADFLLMPGSDNPDYTASKLYPYILAKKPLLAVFHEQSSVVEIMRKTNAGTVVPFKTGESVESVATRILESGWLQQWSEVRGQWSVVSPPSTNWSAFEPYTAREMTRRQCELFDQVMSRRATRPQTTDHQTTDRP